MRRNIPAAGIAAMPIAMRQSRASVAPTIVESTIPTPIPTWKVEHEAAAHRRGRELGDVHRDDLRPAADGEAEQDPARATASNLSGATMQQIAPATKITAMMRIVPRRPRSSESRLQVSAPMIAPSRMLAAIELLPRAADVEVVLDLQQRAGDDPGVVAVEHGGDRRDGGGQVEPAGQGAAAAWRVCQP